MKWDKKLIGLVVAVVLGLSLFLAPVVNRVLPTQAAVTWTKYSGEVTLDSELYVVDAWVIRESSTSYKMWYTHGKKDLTISEIINVVKDDLNLDALIGDIANLDLAQFLDDLGDLAVDVSDIAALFDGISTVIGYATSSDGKSWTVQDSEVLAGSSSAAWDSVGAPCVIKNSDTDYQMWYTRSKTTLIQADFQDILDDIATGNQAERKAAILDFLNSTGTVIGYATWDGVAANWAVEDAQVLPVSSDVGVWGSVADPCVIKNSATDYQMWYTRAKTDVTQANLDTILTNIGDFGIDDLLDILDGTSMVIGYATWDGVSANWTVSNSQVLAGSSSSIFGGVASPSVIKNSDTDYQMWYTNVKTDLVEANLHTLASEIGGLDIAALWTTLTTDGITDFITDLVALDIDATEDILNDTSTVIGYATWDGVSANWIAQTAPDLVGSGSPWSGVTAPSVVKTSSTYQMWYTEGIDELAFQNLLDLVLGVNLPIGYAYYTPPSPPSPPPPEDEVTPEDIEEMTTEEAVEAVEEMTTEEAADIIEELTTDTAADIIEELTTDTAADIIEELATGTAADIIEEIATGTAADIIEELTTDTAADIIEELATGTAADIIEELTTDTAADIIEEVTTDTAADIIEELTTKTAADILEEVVVEKAAAIMEEVSTDTLNDLVGEMSEESLTDTLPEVSADTLHSIDVGTLFDALPSVPTEQLTSEDPPEPPADLTDPIIRYTTPSGAQYVAVRTETGEWVVVMATPEPLDKLMIKTNKALTDVETNVEIFDEQPPEVTVGLPAGQIAMKYINISFENATPEDIDLGHLGFHVANKWLEQNSIHKWSVVLSRYDPELGQWISLPTKRIGEDDTYVYYTVVITRFSTFAISGSRVMPPLGFTATNLAINPLEAGTGEAVTITADITNLSNTAGTYTVTLWVDGTVEAGKDVSLEAGETMPVSFSVIRNVVGSYEVRLDRLFGSFNVIKVVKAPAAFVISDLSITPDVVDIGEEVTISALIANTGDLSGSCEVALKIDNVVIATKKVTLAGGASQKVTFTKAKDVAGTYSVDVSGLAGSFTVKEKVIPPVVPPVVPKAINWWLIGGIIAGVIIIGAVVWQVIARRRT